MDIVCYKCGKEGYIQKDCETDEHEIYGEYIHEIHEGREAEADEHIDRDDYDSNKAQNKTDLILRPPQTVILGASNCKKLQIEESNIHNISVSGTTLNQVQTLLDKSDSVVEAEYVNNVILSLGTNDITKHRDDIEQVMVNLITCVDKIKSKYQNACIGICSVLPRRGKGVNIQTLNSVTTLFNTFAKKLCSNSKIRYIDLWSEFTPNKVPNRALYDLNDPSGVHISSVGAEMIGEILIDYVNTKLEGEYHTPQRRKRMPSSTSTPETVDKLPKMSKSH